MNPNRKRVLLTPALHKYVEEREMERRSQVHGFHERKLSAKSLHATRGEGAKQTKPDLRPGECAFPRKGFTRKGLPKSGIRPS